MNRFFTKTFSRFFFGFLAILILALGILIVVGYATKAQPIAPVDNTTAVQ